ncbi:MAG TPA: Crp/Fnr family transcriptional regulator [Devosia sp.]|jgi:CRP-like cAMP-binding protein|nr:Crp/Fnr family transcriptional regulator [Devosia sp.]
MSEINVVEHELGERVQVFRGPGMDPFLRRLHALYPLQTYETAALAALVQDRITVPPHHELLEEGKPAKEALVLLEGLACHYRTLDNARRQMTGFVVPGDFCDYGFLSSSPVRQCVMTLGPATVGKIDLSQFSSVGEKLPNVVIAAMRAASIDQASARELVISLGARDALQRLAHFLCEIYQRLRLIGLVSPTGQFDLALTQAELGEALGLSTVHVNRTVQQLRKSRFITIAHGRVTILDYPGLAATASFDGRYLEP